MDSKTSSDTLSEQQHCGGIKHFLLQCFVLMTSEVRMRNIHTTPSWTPSEPHQHISSDVCVQTVLCQSSDTDTLQFWLCSFASKLQNVEPRLPLRRVFTSWWIFSGLMFTVWQFQVECVSAFEPASCSTLRWSRAVTSPLILKSGARIQIITEKLINVCLKVNNGQYLRIEGDEHGEGPHWCQNRFISTTHQI